MFFEIDTFSMLETYYLKKLIERDLSLFGEENTNQEVRSIRLCLVFWPFSVYFPAFTTLTSSRILA